jgi:phenylalanyl-tRNA synthetase beta chain
MKFTLNWLKDFLETDASLLEISTKLTAIGLEVESISNPEAALKAFTVAKILSAEKHPEADKLQVCKVHADVGELQIVCGAPNARAGLYVALAKEGTFIPKGEFTIKKTKIRGVESNGMLCSFEELGIDGDSAGIIELPEAPIGGSVAAALGLNDAVIEIAITPNRGDCLGVYGIARDLAAAGVGTLKDLGFRIQDSGVVSPITVSTLTPNCTHFVGCHITGVKNQPSPAWLQQRLSAIGLKPISALVDITNYICFTYGRPLHVFDAAKLQGNLCARAAKDGEKIKALNDKEYTLKSDMTVIADDQKALGIAGIMGGLETGCTLETTDVFLESAWFDPINIATTGRALDILSDARYRFERGTDPEFVRKGAEIAVQMIVEICGGTPSVFVETRTSTHQPRQIGFSPNKIEALSGVVVDSAKAKTILSVLGFDVKEHGKDWGVTVPSWRPDVQFEADLVEEVVRIVGYNSIPNTPLPNAASYQAPTQHSGDVRASAARKVLANRGYLEACTFSFISEKEAAMFGGGALKLQNPISADLAVMRPSLLPNLLAAAKRNQFRGVANVELCEVGLTFQDITPSGQTLVAAGINVGQVEESGFNAGNLAMKPRPYDAYDAKASAFAVLEQLGVNTAQVRLVATPPAHYHPGRASLITLGGKIQLGVFGELHPSIVKEYDLTGGAVGFELNLMNIPEARKKAKPALVLNELQPISRDFAFTMKRDVSADALIKAAMNADKALITQAEVFDVYMGKGMAENEKSIAIRLRIEPRERTLTDAEIQAIGTKVVDAAKAIGAVLRA